MKSSKPQKPPFILISAMASLAGFALIAVLLRNGAPEVASEPERVKIEEEEVRPPSEIGRLYNRSVVEMNAHRWEEALRLTEEIITKFSENAYDDYGAMFGGIYYNQGICLIRLKRYRDAAMAYKTCYEDFPNVKPKGKEEAPDSLNPYEKTALFQWGLALQLLSEYAEAIRLYEHFLTLNPTLEEMQPAAYYINVGICQANIGNVEKSEEMILRVFENAPEFGATVSSLLQGFVQLAEAWLDAGQAGEVSTFMDRCGGQMRMSPYEMHRYNALVTRVAKKSMEVKEYDCALRLYGICVTTREAIDDLEQRPVVDGRQWVELERLRAILGESYPVDAHLLWGRARCHVALKNLAEAHESYQELVAGFPATVHRPDILVEANRVALEVGKRTE